MYRQWKKVSDFFDICDKDGTYTILSVGNRSEKVVIKNILMMTRETVNKSWSAFNKTHKHV